MVESQVPMPGASPVMPLIGREREATALWWQYAQAMEGRAQVALIAGEPGIGKTRLLDHLADRATAAGATVVRGGASAATGMPPYLPFLEAIGAYLRRMPLETLREQLGRGGAILSSIFPELPARLGALPAAYALPPEQSRLRLFEAVGDLLAAIAAAAPLLLILDDLH